MIYLIKNVVNKIILALSDIYIRHFGGKNQFLPSLEDIENEELKKLANRLEGDSNKETLTNILEWEERNILGWEDRMYMFIIFYFLFSLSALFLPINPLIKCIFTLFLILLAFINFALVLSYYIPFVGSILILFSLVYIANPVVGQNMLPVYSFVPLSVLFGAFIGLIIYLLLRYQNVKSLIPEFKRRDMFKLTLPVKKILTYKLAICRDYAKLTAALFFNYSDSKVYFFTIQSHVATAVKINDEYYVLDQKLPVLTKDGWLKRWNVKEANVYASELVRNSKGEMVAVNFKKHEKVSLPDISMKDDNTDNIDEFTDKVSKLLGINQISQNEILDLNYLLKDYAVYYEDNEIVKYSLSRAIKNKLENEFCGNVDKISKIEINQCENDKDLKLSVYL